MPLLEIDDLRVHYPGPTPELPVRAVDGMSLALVSGESYALVGESGCGKSATGLALLRVVEPGRIVGGSIRFEGRELTGLSEREMRGVRGGGIGIAFQEPGAALNPVLRVGSQIAEVVRLHVDPDRAAARAETLRLLERVALDEPERVARAYPHELSGGMQQRVMLAIALAGRPRLLIADEPTTALDVTVQAQILELIRRLRDELGLTVLLITHDLAVVAENADRVGVMSAGRLVEQAPVAELFERPLHPYTRALIRCIPRGAASDGARELPTLPGGVPDPVSPPAGCRFHPRCAERLAHCDAREPELGAAGPNRSVACFLHEEAS